MSKLIVGFFESVIKFRIFVIIGTLLLLVLSFIPMGNLYMQQSQEMWLPDADQTLEDFNHIRERFGPNQYLTIGLSASDAAHPVYNVQTLTAIDEITRFLDGHELVVKVNSLSNHQYMEQQQGTLWQRDTVTDEDYDQPANQRLGAVQKRVDADPLSQPNVINDAQTFARIAALIVYRQDDVMQHLQVTNDLKSFIQSKGYSDQGITFEFSGFPYIAAKTTTNIMQDQSIMMPIMLVLLIVLLRLVLGRWAYIWIPLSLSALTLTMTLGLMGLLGFALNMVNASLTLIIIAISVADSVHMINHFNSELRQSGNAKAAAINTGVALWRPCWFTSLTTVLGFLSLGFSDMAPVKEYGYIAAAAILIAYLLSLTVVLSWLSFIKKAAVVSWVVKALPALLKRVIGFAILNSRAVLTVSVLVCVVCALLAAQLTADANYLRFFKANSSVATGIHFFDQEFSGANSIEFSLDSGAENGIYDPEFLQRAADFQEDLTGIQGVGEAQSLNKYLMNMKRIFTGVNALPASVQETAQYLFLYSSSDPIEDLTDLRSFDGRYYRVSLPVKNIDASQMRDLLDAINGLIESEYKDLNIILSGDLYLQHRTEHYIQVNLVESFSIALLTIVVSLLLVFRSLSIGVISLLPSLMPILIAAGIMSIFNVYLDFGTMIVASIMIGIAVDDTIHIISDYLKAQHQGENLPGALDYAAGHSGAAVTSTSLILFFSFIVMSFSSFMPNVYFGVFSSIIIVGALFSNLFLLPALLTQLHKLKRKVPLVEVKG